MAEKTEKKTKMFDLASFSASQLNAASVRILRPDGEPTDILIKVLSPDSAEYRIVSMQVQNEQLKYSMKNRGKTTAERLAQSSLDLLVGVTVAWDGIAENGAILPFSPENVRRVYENYPFIREQVDEFLGDRRNFFKS